MAKAGVSDRQKLEGCLAGTRMVLEGKNASDLKVISAFLKRQIGPGWTVVTAAQWLTGKGAWEAIEQMGPESVAGGCSKAEAMMIVAFAAEFCRELDASGGTDLALERLKVAAIAGELCGATYPLVRIQEP